jgi:aquaglyceroporin related protein
MATWRGFPWRKVPGMSSQGSTCNPNGLIFLISGYILAQVLGGIFGSAIVYGNYINAINIFEGGNDIRTQATASLFATYAVSHLFSLNRSQLI